MTPDATVRQSVAAARLAVEIATTAPPTASPRADARAALPGRRRRTRRPGRGRRCARSRSPPTAAPGGSGPCTRSWRGSTRSPSPRGRRPARPPTRRRWRTGRGLVAQHRDLEVERRHRPGGVHPQAVAQQLRLGVGLDDLAGQRQRLGIRRHVVDHDADLVHPLERDQPAFAGRGGGSGEGSRGDRRRREGDHEGTGPEGEPFGSGAHVGVCGCKRGATHTA